MRKLEQGWNNWNPCADERKIKGVGKEAPAETTKNGGKQSKLEYRFDLLDPQAIFAIAKVLYEGVQKYEEWNWLKITSRDHINHALSHIFAHLADDTQDEHLEHALCRLMMAVRKNIDEGRRIYNDDAGI